jgi:predicted  nucleic acid-binding Zn-ribbon protein
MNGNIKLESIRKLHRLDCKLINLRRKHKELPDSLQQLEQAVQEKEKAVQEAEGHLKALRSRYDAKELELKSYEAEIAKFEGQLRSVKTNKEYSAILSEITTKKADVAKTEDEMLMLMDSIDQQEETIREHRRDEEFAQRNRTEHRGQIAAQQQEVDQQLKELTEEREQRTAGIEPSLLHQYQRILEKRGTTAVVPVVENSCQGCFMKLSSEVQAQLLKNESIVYCRFCSRIIYLE